MFKTLLRSVIIACVCFCASQVLGYSYSMYPYELPSGKKGATLGCVRAERGMKLEPGKWYTNFEVCKDYADANGIPLMAIWSNNSCIHCWFTDVVFIQDQFIQWQQTSDAGKVIYCFMAGGDDDIDQIGSKAYNWMWKDGGVKLNEFPFVVMWWKKENVNVRLVGDVICRGNATSDLGLNSPTIPTRVDNVIAAMEKAFEGWKWNDGGKYTGGMVELEESDGHRLEAEAAKRPVIVELIRKSEVIDIATNNVIDVVDASGSIVSTTNVVWAAGQEMQEVSIDISNLEFSEDGENAFLLVKDAEGTVVGTNSITYVDKPNSAANPLWIGERSAGAPVQARGTDAVPQLAWGEWTMDYEVATQRVAQAEGEAYTLVAVQGSLWCPDCENTKRNFLSVTNEFGNNYFSEWAKSNQVAFVTVDIPSFTTNSVVCESPTLLSRKAYLTSLARAKEIGVSGATIDMVDKSLHSGLGYLTRKGVSDEEALAVLERNRIFVQTDTSAGGFHCPSDRSSYRTGVPIFVLLRKDGSVAARMTTFASKSPMTADREKIEDILKRFDELLAIADAEGTHFDDIENDYPGDGAIAFSANGGEASGEISHCDFKDVFKLNGVGGNALQKISVEGASDADVVVKFCTIDEDGSKKYVGDGVTGKLSSGVTLEYTFTEPGDYYVEVSGVDITSESFAAESTKVANFHPFKVSGDVVLVPQEKYADAEPGEELDYVVVRIAKDTVYKFTGVHVGNLNKAVLKPLDEDDTYCEFFTALVDGDVFVPLRGAELRYQIWKPGKVGFVTAVASTNEAVGDYFVALARTDGTSGDVTIEVVLDEENTTFYNSDGEKRFSFEPLTITWKEGVEGTTNITVKVLEDERFDGAGDVALKFTVKDGLAEAVQDTFVLTVKDNDIQAAGKVAFVGAEPFYSKKLTVYVREGESATIYAKRLDASDGPVSVGVKSSLAGVEISGDVSDGELQWGNHKYEDKSVAVKGVPAGKTATITLYNAMDGLKILSASNNVRVVGVAADAPWFVNDTASANLYRYVASSNSYPVLVQDGVDFTKTTFSKLMGTLPAGLKVSWDKEANAMVVSGTVTAKAGVYESVYQAVLVNGSKRIPGLTMKLKYTVRDLAAENAEAEPESQSPVFGKSRTLKDIPVIDEADGEGKKGLLVGTLTVTLPANGKGNVSAKYRSINGDISFTSKGWSSYGDDDGFVAKLTSRKEDYSMTLTEKLDGSIKIELYDGDSDEVYTAEHSGIQWSRENPAASWKGYYTVVLPVETVDESHDGLAPSGAGYITLKMNTTSAVNSGKVTWAGMLPNGTAVSGSSVLGSVNDENWASLPVFKYSSTDVVAIGARILANSGEIEEPRSVESDDGVYSRWEHKERDAAFNAWYKVGLGVYGGLYRTKDAEGKDFDLAACCTEYYETVNPVLAFYFSMLDEAGDEFLVLDPVATAVGAKTLTFADKAAVPSGMTMSLNRTTGVVSGAFELSLKDADGSTTVPAKWKGVVVQGWGPGCNCAPGEDGIKYLPFVCGAYYYTDRIDIDTDDGAKTTSVKCGGVVTIGKP